LHYRADLVSNSASFAQRPLATSSTNTATVPELSSEGQAWLRAAISGGSLPDLRWPDFSDYSKHLKKFYEFNQESLWWIKAMEPTMQAQQVIARYSKRIRKDSPQRTMTDPGGTIGWQNSNPQRGSRRRRML
jgi:hypothetical protein